MTIAYFTSPQYEGQHGWSATNLSSTGTFAGVALSFLIPDRVVSIHRNPQCRISNEHRRNGTMLLGDMSKYTGGNHRLIAT